MSLTVQRYKLFRNFSSFFVDFSTTASQFSSEGHAVCLKSYSGMNNFPLGHSGVSKYSYLLLGFPKGKIPRNALNTVKVK